ncbi:MAG: DUF2341 domain-containing protein [Candidatus Hodarchaeota archaeon]
MLITSKTIRIKLISLLLITIFILNSTPFFLNSQYINNTEKMANFDNRLIKSSDWDAVECMYRREITLTPATPESDYQIRVDLNLSNFNYSKAKSDGSDIRFYDLSQNILDYWIESWNPAGNSIIWVKIPAAGTSKIYMYYGNPTAFSLSNGSNTFIFFDDFEGTSLDLLKWDTEIGSYCGITVSSGYVRLYSATPSAFVEFAEVGFHDFEGQQGVPFSKYYTNGHAMTHPLTDTSWFTGEIRIINSTYAPFYKNDIFDSLDASTRTGPLPVRILSHSCVGGSGNPYWAYISSLDTSLGVPGRAVRFEGWVNVEDIADFRAQWVFVFKFNDSNPNVNIGEEITIYDLPEINIISPISGDFFSENPPFFNVSIIESNLNKTWYTLDDGASKFIFNGSEGIINQTEWDKQIDGPVKIRFYANNTSGYEDFKEVIVFKDTSVPIISIISPNADDFFAENPPGFDITIAELSLNTTWYTIDNGASNITFTGLTGTINQTEWDEEFDGPIIIRFYANDTFGKINYNEITIFKDITDPVIKIHSPSFGEVFTVIPPAFNVSVDEPNFDSLWYTIDGGLSNHSISQFTGYIHSTVWNLAPAGAITIRFYSKDRAGNIGYTDIIVQKSIPPQDLDINLIIIIVTIISIVGIVVVGAIVYNRKHIRIKPPKPKAEVKKKDRNKRGIKKIAEPQIINCPYCQNMITSDQRYCKFCGADLRTL